MAAPLIDPLLRAILTIGVLIVTAKLLGELFLSLKLPQILGELVAGIIFGPFLLGGAITIYGAPLVELKDIPNTLLTNSSIAVPQEFLATLYVRSLAQIGAIVILFIAGLSISFAQFRASGVASFTVAGFGVITPLLLGFLVLQLGGFSTASALIVGAALTATSIAITVRTLEGIGKINTGESHVVINAAVIDDVLALAVVSIIVSVITAGAEPTFLQVASAIVKSLALWLLVLLMGVAILPKFVDRSEAWRVEGSVEALAISICFAAAALSAAVGLSPVVGAFAAGMAIGSSKAHVRVENFMHNIGLIFSPIFFAVTGAALNPAFLFRGGDLNYPIVASSLGLIGIAVVGKVLGCGLPALIFSGDWVKGLRVGVGMVSRGEVGLIVAGLGLTTGILSSAVYGQIILMVISTTIMTPILLEAAYTRLKTKDEKPPVVAVITKTAEEDSESQRLEGPKGGL